MNRGQVVNNGKVAVFACGVQAGLSILDNEKNRKKRNKCAKSLKTLQKKKDIVQKQGTKTSIAVEVTLSMK